VPTAAIGVIGVSRRSASVRDEWRRTLTLYSGLRFTVDDVRYPRPGAMLLERVRGYDPETDALVLDCRYVEIERGSDGIGIRALQPEIYAERAARLFEALERCLRREWPEPDVTVTVSADALTWHAGGTAQTLEEVLVRLGPADSAQQLLAGFSLPGTAANRPIALEIRRTTTSGPPLTTVVLETVPVAVPTAIFGPLTELSARLGPRAQFVGRMTLDHTDRGWNGSLEGDFLDVDLEALSGGCFPGALGGSAEVRVHRFRLADGRIENAHLTIHSSGGQIGRSLVAAGREYLGLGNPTAALPVSQVTPFDGLSLDLRLENDGTLVVHSRSPDERRPILWRGSEIFWHAPTSETQPIMNLLRVLAPDRGLLVPAERRAAEMMQWLPLPKRGEAPTGGAPGTSLPQELQPMDFRLRLKGAVEERAGG
jgi:hypothetical protein